MFKALMQKSFTAAACALLLAGQGYGADPRQIDVPAGDLVTALEALSKQAEVNLVYQAGEMHGLKTAGVKGSLTPREAVVKLLEGTSLRLSTDKATGAMMISATNAPAMTSVEAATDAGIRLAGTENPENMQRVENHAAGSAGSQVSGPEPDVSANISDQGGKGVPEILVKGSRSQNADIRRTEDDVQPYVVFDAGTIERSMALNIEDFLKRRLPMNGVAATNAQQAETAGNTSVIDLRGLGSDETLILVNGRRMPGMSNIATGQGTIGQADINGIPLSAVERIEVLPSTASGIYGGGATGGVVNIILKSDFNRMDVGLTYDNTFDTDSGTRRLDVTAGFNFEGGRTNVLLTGSYSDGNALTVGDRDFVRRGYRLYIDNTSDTFESGFSPPLGSTANIRMLEFGSDLTELYLIDPNGGPDIPLGSTITHVPVGYAGLQSDGAAALLNNAGSFNIELPTDIQGLQGGAVNNPVVSSLAASLRRSFTDRIDAFVDLSVSRNEGRYLDGSDTSSFVLCPRPGSPEDFNCLADFFFDENGIPVFTFAYSAGNPFANAVEITFPMPGLAFERTFISGTRIANGGFIVRLPREWIGHAEYSWSRSRSEFTSTSPIVSDAGKAAIDAGTFDIFRDLNVFAPDYGNGFILPSPNNFGGPFDNTRTGATVRLAGPAFELPGGALGLSAFYEHHQSTIDEGFWRQHMARIYYAERSQKVDSVSLEITAPLFSGRNARPWLHGLDLQASVRYDDYQVNGVESNGVNVPEGQPLPELGREVVTVDSADYTLGLRYAPSRDIALRASFGTGFLPPGVGQITQSIPTTTFPFFGLADPRRGDTPATVRAIRISGGNPDLRPEQSESLSAGVILTPRVLPGLRLSADFTEISKQDEISSFFFPAQFLLDNEDIFANRVVRDPLSAADTSLGYTGGPITHLDFTLVNLARSTVRAWDMQLDYTFEVPAGRVRAYALGTYLPDYITQLRPDVPAVNHAGHVYRLKWRGNAGLTLERDNWSLDWNMQYFDRYFIAQAGLPPGTLTSDEIAQGSRTIPRQIYHDLHARVRLGDPAPGAGFLANTELLLGIINVFNASPPIIATPFPANGYSFFGDPRLRRYSVSLRKSFH